MKGCARQLAVVAATIGGLCLAGSFWIPAKAALAQILIEAAWSRVLSGEVESRPWPWADTWPVARLVVPRLGRAVLALEGASGHAMAFGPAHVSSTARPGASDNVAFAGHRDTHFAFLRELREGDSVMVEGVDGPVHYAVASIRVVHESATEVLAPTGAAGLTLITCYPFDAIEPGGPLRLVVHASKIVAVEPQLDGKSTPSPQS